MRRFEQMNFYRCDFDPCRIFHKEGGFICSEEKKSNKTDFIERKCQKVFEDILRLIIIWFVSYANDWAEKKNEWVFHHQRRDIIESYWNYWCITRITKRVSFIDFPKKKSHYVDFHLHFYNKLVIFWWFVSSQFPIKFFHFK